MILSRTLRRTQRQIHPVDDCHGELQTVMPYDSYRLYQIQRTKSPAEIRRADEQAARIASALAALFGAITRRRRIATDRSPKLCRALPDREEPRPDPATPHRVVLSRSTQRSPINLRRWPGA